MLGTALDATQLAVVLAGALVAGFTTGFAGFGTGLVASGLWFHALPASMVPPLVALATVAAQIASLARMRKSFAWSRAAPFLAGGAAGVPIGVAGLAAASPARLRVAIGVFLVMYALYQLVGHRQRTIGGWGGRPADALVGLGGGLLGGFAGLPGPLPVIWLQLRGEARDRQRATYQPFNLVVLALACLVMAVGGQITPQVLQIAAICLPATLTGAWIGGRVYVGVSQQVFQRIVLVLLLVSGTILLWGAATH